MLQINQCLLHIVLLRCVAQFVGDSSDSKHSFASATGGWQVVDDAQQSVAETVTVNCRRDLRTRCKGVE